MGSVCEACPRNSRLWPLPRFENSFLLGKPAVTVTITLLFPNFANSQLGMSNAALWIIHSSQEPLLCMCWLPIHVFIHVPMDTNPVMSLAVIAMQECNELPRLA